MAQGESQIQVAPSPQPARKCPQMVAPIVTSSAEAHELGICNDKHSHEHEQTGGQQDPPGENSVVRKRQSGDGPAIGDDPSSYDDNGQGQQCGRGENTEHATEELAPPRWLSASSSTHWEGTPDANDVSAEGD